MNAVKQAIEALENVRHHISSASIYFANGEAEQGQKILGDAIRMVMETEAALAALRSMPAEPVAWGMPDPETGQVYDCISPQEHDFIAGGYTIPLYATPHTAPVPAEPTTDVPETDCGNMQPTPMRNFAAAINNLVAAVSDAVLGTPLRAMPAEPVAWYDVEDGQFISARRWYSDGGRTEAPLYSAPHTALVPPDWSEVGRLMDAVSAASAGRYMVGTTNWAAFICRQMKQATPHTAPVLTEAWQPIETAPDTGYMLVHEDGAIRALMRMEGVWKKVGYPGLVEPNYGDVLVGQDAERVLPKGYRMEVRDGCCENPTHWMPLPPPPAAERTAPVPLSDDELWELWSAQGSDFMDQKEAIQFARAIERAVRGEKL